jgi:hypothetical protein
MILTIASKGPDITAQVALNPSEIQYWIKYDTCDHKFDVINEESEKDQKSDSDYVTISNMSNDYFPSLYDIFDKHALTDMTVNEVIGWILSEKKNGVAVNL